VQREDGYREMADKPIVEIARTLRQRETSAEQILWEALRDRRLNGLKFRRQHPIANTTFVADFLCYEARLAIELDGGIHAQQQVDDRTRQEMIESLGYRVLRFSNTQVYDALADVLSEILRAVQPSPSNLKMQPSPPTPLPKEGRTHKKRLR